MGNMSCHHEDICPESKNVSPAIQTLSFSMAHLEAGHPGEHLFLSDCSFVFAVIPKSPSFGGQEKSLQ